MRHVVILTLLLALLTGCGSSPAPTPPTPGTESGKGPLPVPTPPAPTGPTLVVDPAGGDGKFKTVTEALEKAEPQTTIKVKPGTYTEALVISKDVTIQGDGPAKDVIIQFADTKVIVVNSPEVHLNGFSVKQTGIPGVGINVNSGRVFVDGCDVTATGIGLVSTTSRTECHVTKCTFHGCAGGGIQNIDSAICIAEDNELTDCDVAALTSRRKADAVFKRNKIINSKKCGILIYEQGTATLDDNEIKGSGESGIVAANNHHCMARGNKVLGSQGDGIFVAAEGKGTFENNEIRDSKQSGVSINNAEANVLKNKISGNQFGISALDNARSKIEDNEITGNTVNGLVLTGGGATTAKGNTISKNKESGVLIKEKGKALLDKNNIFENGVDGVTIIFGGSAMGSKNSIHDNAAAGIHISNASSGDFKENDVFDNNDIDSTLRNHKAPPAGKFKPTPEQKGWALAVCAVMMRRDGLRDDLLASDVRSPETIAAHKTRMKQAWGISDKETLMTKLKLVEESGYRKEFESQAASLRLVDDAGFQKQISAERDPERRRTMSLMRSASQRYDKKSMLGYDMCNYIALCRWGYLVGYLDESAAWDLIMPKAQLLQKSFDSFEEISENYDVGVQLSIPDKALRTDTQAAFDELRKDTASPWRKYLWTQKLE